MKPAPASVRTDETRENQPWVPRLQRYLKKLEGTPLEMTYEKFVARVVSQALDKLEG